MAGPRQRVMLVVEFNPETVHNERVAEALHHAANVVSMTKVLTEEVDIIIAPKLPHEDWPQVRITSDDPNPEVPY